jgi:hypothetical protein
MIFYTLGGIPVVVMWSIWAESVITWLGFDTETARIGRLYAIPFNIKAIVLGINLCLNEFLLFTHHETYSTISQTIQFVTQLIPIILIATTTQLRDLTTLGYIQLGVALLYLTGNWIFVVSQGWLNEYWEGLCHSWAMKVRVWEDEDCGMIVCQTIYSTTLFLVSRSLCGWVGLSVSWSVGPVGIVGFAVCAGCSRRRGKKLFTRRYCLLAREYILFSLELSNSLSPLEFTQPSKNNCMFL